METVGPEDVGRPPNRTELLELYAAAIAEYRFQVQLTWDRAKHYLVFSGVLLGAATGLLRLGDGNGSYWLVGLILLFTGLNAISGGYSVNVSHKYYRSARSKKAVFEKALGLTAPIAGFDSGTSFAIETTPGMEGQASDRKPSGPKITITRQICWLLVLVGAASLVAASLAIYHAQR